jgi:predicted nucleic acid-binding protein
VTLVVDSGPLVASVDVGSRAHAAVAKVLKDELGSLVLSSFVAAEADYLIWSRFGTRAELAYLDDLAAGTYEVVSLEPSELEVARDLVRTYRDLEIGLSDASIVILARRFRTRRILSFDEPDFRTIAPLQGGHFTILPADV